MAFGDRLAQINDREVKKSKINGDDTAPSFGKIDTSYKDPDFDQKPTSSQVDDAN